MAIGKYILPQKRNQDSFPNIENTLTSLVKTQNLIERNQDDQDRCREKFNSGSDWLLRDTMQEITSFDTARLNIGSDTTVSNTEAELLCTYNWISSKPSAIYVPGKVLSIIQKS